MKVYLPFPLHQAILLITGPHKRQEFLVAPSVPFVSELAYSFTSAKDPNWDSVPACRDKSTVCLFILANYKWFERWKDLPEGARGPEYEAVIKNIGDKMLRNFFKLYPHMEQHMTHAKVDTPLSSCHYVKVCYKLSFSTVDKV